MEYTFINALFRFGESQCPLKYFVNVHVHLCTNSKAFDYLY